MRFLFTSLARDSEGVKAQECSDYAQVISGVPVALFNASFFFPSEEGFSLESWVQHLQAFNKTALPAMICVGSDHPKESLKALEQAGTSVKTKEYDLALDIQRFKVPWFIPRSVKLREAATEDDIHLWTDLFFSNFKLPDEGREYFMKLIRARDSLQGIRAQFFVALKNKKPVGTIALIHEGDVTAGYCVSIVPDARSFGTGTMMIASVLRLLKRSSCRYMIGNSNEAGYRIYRKAQSLIHLGETLIYFTR